MANFSLEKSLSRHEADIRRHALRQHDVQVQTREQEKHDEPKYLGTISSVNGPIQLLQFPNPDPQFVANYMEKRSQARQISDQRNLKREQALRDREIQRLRKSALSESLEFNPPSREQLLLEALGVSQNIAANRGSLIPSILAIIGVLGATAWFTLNQNKDSQVNLASLLTLESNKSTQYSFPPDGIKQMPMPIFQDWLPNTNELPATSATWRALQGIPAERVGQVIELVFPDNRTVPVRMPGTDAQAAQKFLNKIVDYITWQDSWDSSRPYTNGSRPLSFGQQGTVTLEQIDKKKLTDAIKSHPDYEYGGVRIPSNKMPGAVKYITPDSAVKVAEAGTELASEVVTALAKNGTNVDKVVAGILGSGARGEADPRSESDFDIKLTVYNDSQFIKIAQDIEALASKGVFENSLKKAYQRVEVHPSKGLYGHIIIFLVDEANGAVKDTWNELIILHK